MSTGQQPDGSAPPPPEMPAVRAVPVPPGNSYFERLAAPLPKDAGGQGESLAEREARRLAARLPEGYEPRTGADLTFDPRIAYELALGVASPSEVFAKYGVPEVHARKLIGNAVFISTIKRYKEEVTSGGISFKLKAKIQAEDLLSHSYLLATDPEVPAAVRADLIKWTAKMAGLEPDAREKGGGGAGSGFTLSILFAGAPTPAVVQGTVVEGSAHRIEE